MWIGDTVPATNTRTTAIATAAVEHKHAVSCQLRAPWPTHLGPTSGKLKHVFVKMAPAAKSITCTEGNATVQPYNGPTATAASVAAHLGPTSGRLGLLKMVPAAKAITKAIATATVENKRALYPNHLGPTSGRLGLVKMVPAANSIT